MLVATSAIFVGLALGEPTNGALRAAAQPAIVSVPVAFLTMIVVSLRDPRRFPTSSRRCSRCTHPRASACGWPTRSSSGRSSDLPPAGRSSGRFACMGHRVHETTPQVFLVARPSVDVDGMRAYLEPSAGSRGSTCAREARDWDGELLAEFGGRMCYRSWEPGLNPNVTRIRTDQEEYFANVLRSAHGSVLEHANYSFAFRNVSRVFTHELVRHRAGSAFSQESLRYVRLTDIGFRVPPALEPLRDQVISLVEQLEEFQLSAAEQLELDNGEMPFAVKKEITSALRRLAPIGLSTDILWTANVRTLRHVIEMRTAPGAEEELRLVFNLVAEMMKAEAPSLFQDFSRDEDGSWVPEWRKV